MFHYVILCSEPNKVINIMIIAMGIVKYFNFHIIQKSTMYIIYRFQVVTVHIYRK